MSSIGSTFPETWITSPSSKQRTTWMMASVSRMFVRNLFPRPSPSEAPLTRPAMSTKVTVAGTSLLLPEISERIWRRGSLDFNNADVGVDGAERVVGNGCCRFPSESVKECRFSDVGESDDTACKSCHIFLPSKRKACSKFPLLMSCVFFLKRLSRFRRGI